MKILALLLIFFIPIPVAAQTNFSISGSIRDTSGRSVDSIRVSLLDDNYQSVRTIFSSAGRYQFRGLRSGAYFVKIETTGTNYEEDTSPRIEVQSMRRRRGASEEFYADFLLRPKKELKKDAAPSVVFAQTVPEPARLEYERGTKSLHEGKTNVAEDSFKKAIELFPDYFAALETLGIEYARQGEHQAAIPVLTHALEVNRTASRCMYALGVAHLKLNQFDESIQWLEKSAGQDPQSINVHMMLGLAYGNKRQLDKAEASLKKAYQVGGAQAAEAHLYLAGLYNGQKRYSEAVSELELYLKEGKDIDQAKIRTMIDNLKAKS